MTLKKNDICFHKVYGHVTITEDESDECHFIGCKLTLNNKVYDYVKLSISSLSKIA